MAENEEEDRFARTFMSLISTGVGVTSLALAVLTLTRQREVSRRRVYYDDGRCLVSVRYYGEWHDIRGFVTPSDPDVVALYREIGPDHWGCLDWVGRNISYRSDIGEFFQFPSETLARGSGDCDDSANLLTSLLRNFAPAYSVLGTYCGYGHAWCTLRNGEILESTFTSARRVPDPQNYIAYAKFNESFVEEAWPGGIQDIYAMPRREAAKLRLMANGD